MDLFEGYTFSGKFLEKGFNHFPSHSRILLTRSIMLPVVGFAKKRVYVCMHARVHACGKCSHAHPRRDRSWEKVRQSEANLVIGIRSTPDGDRSPLSRHAEESTLPLIQVRLRSFRLDDAPIGRAESIEGNNCHYWSTWSFRKHALGMIVTSG